MPGVWVFPGGAVHGEEAVSGPSGWDEASLDPEELAHRACAVRELREEAAIALAEDVELIPWSRWITPDGGPIRFDTRFYVALAPAHAPPQADGAETTDARWFSPAMALERHRAGEMSLVFPTIRHLEELLPAAQRAEVGILARVPLASGLLTGKYDESTTFLTFAPSVTGSD